MYVLSEMTQVTQTCYSLEEEGADSNRAVYCSNGKLCVDARRGKGSRRRLGAFLKLLAHGTDLRCTQCHNWFHSQNCLDLHASICRRSTIDEGSSDGRPKRMRVDSSPDPLIDGNDIFSTPQVISMFTLLLFLLPCLTSATLS